MYQYQADYNREVYDYLDETYYGGYDIPADVTALLADAVLYLAVLHFGGRTTKVSRLKVARALKHHERFVVKMYQAAQDQIAQV